MGVSLKRRSVQAPLGAGCGAARTSFGLVHHITQCIRYCYHVTLDSCSGFPPGSERLHRLCWLGLCHLKAPWRQLRVSGEIQDPSVWEVFLFMCCFN